VFIAQQLESTDLIGIESPTCVLAWPGFVAAWNQALACQ
jgi:hypothetical protein